MVRRWRPRPWLPTDLCDLEAEHDSLSSNKLLWNTDEILVRPVFWMASWDTWALRLITADGGKPCVFTSVWLINITIFYVGHDMKNWVGENKNLFGLYLFNKYGDMMVVSAGSLSLVHHHRAVSSSFTDAGWLQSASRALWGGRQQSEGDSCPTSSMRCHGAGAWCASPRAAARAPTEVHLLTAVLICAAV